MNHSLQFEHFVDFDYMNWKVEGFTVSLDNLDFIDTQYFHKCFRSVAGKELDTYKEVVVLDISSHVWKYSFKFSHILADYENTYMGLFCIFQF